MITGGAWFIGSHLTRRLLDEGHDVLVVDNLGAAFKPDGDDGPLNLVTAFGR